MIAEVCEAARPSPHLLAALEPLLEVLPSVGGVRLAMLSSANVLSLDEVGDLDLHIVLDEMSCPIFERLVEAAGRCGAVLADATGAPWFVETRRGPFMPNPDEIAAGQVHLLLDDRTSLRRLPIALALHYRAGVLAIWGQEIETLIEMPTALEPRLEGCVAEVSRFRRAVADGVLPFRYWSFDPEVVLEDADEPLTDAWSHRCLLKLCASVADRMCLRVFSEHAEALARLVPRLRWLYPEVHDQICSWRGLDRRWTPIRQTVLDVLDNRLEMISNLG